MDKQFPAYYCQEAFIDVVLPADEIKIDESNQWLIIGYPGVDGIEFRVYKHKRDAAVYAYYPIDDEHIWIANSAEDLISKWKEGKIVL
ncbi:hypothetical protein Q0590_37210 [Rhodocytophaga aerolata]|uniref:Uncharacterized protein n=1 Tax=Rhodocytophaga aerolata TaxID=455078 RepID=A0ABT8RIQ1_9BACT|nr:hypothetical protein [Rhodocytophaga aerolata]MDO1451968.1 hypothetical protein [Rhodocytophaga aerolata]